MNIEVRNLTKTFGTLRANDAITLSFAAGRVHGVLGENGAGKSTLMKLLSGFLRRDSGEILVDGRPAAIDQPLDALQSGIGMVHQEPLDIPAFSAAENFYCAGPRDKIPSVRAARKILTDLGERLGFTVPPDTQVGHLTIGQRQQLEIMRLLACGAQIFILDEPTTGITAAQARALFAALTQLASEGKTILFVSHKLDEVSDLCNTVSVLRNGRVVGEQVEMPIPKAQMLQLMFGDLQSGQTAAPATEAPTSAAPTWSLDRVTLRDGTLDLRNLTLDLAPGTITGLAGLDGSGQQLLLRLLAGRLHPTAGQLRLNGQQIRHDALKRFLQAGIHYLPADRLNEGMIGALSLSEHFALQYGQGFLVDEGASRSTARHAIEGYAIKATPNMPIAALSGGNQQRAMLALLPDQCSGILLEQPTRGLDVASARAIWERLIVRRASGTAIVFTSADLEELLAYSDQVIVFFGGRVSRPVPRAELSETRLAELIGGVGFEQPSAGM